MRHCHGQEARARAASRPRPLEQKPLAGACVELVASIMTCLYNVTVVVANRAPLHREPGLPDRILSQGIAEWALSLHLNMPAPAATGNGEASGALRNMYAC